MPKMKLEVFYSGNSWFIAVWVHRPHGRGWMLGGLREFVCKPTRRQLRDANRDARRAYQRGREVMRGRSGSLVCLQADETAGSRHSESAATGCP